MIINNLTKTSNVDNSGDFDTQHITFSTDKVAKMFMIVLKGYSDPIGSLVREITSNCLDAHTEAGVTLPVEIAIHYDDGGKYITFEDKGVGISTDRFNKIYRKLLESTKENSNDQLGGWGLGSKTPLAYRDEFYLTTRYNNIEYSYLIFMNTENGCPDTALLYEKETDLPNGTTVKIYMEDSDETTFVNACKKQLIYFDNVIFKGDLEYYNFKNEYKIYESNYYKYRPDITDTNLRVLHICIDKVVYPLNISKLINKDKPFEYLGNIVDEIPLPFALKFKTGDLKVTPTREQIEYNRENIEVLTNKIKEFLDNFISELNNKIGDNVFKGNFIEYTKYLKELDKNSKNISIVENYTIKIPVHNFLFKLLPEIKWEKVAHLPVKFTHASALNLLHIRYKVRHSELPFDISDLNKKRWSFRSMYDGESTKKYLYVGHIENSSEFHSRIKCKYKERADIYRLAKLDFDSYSRHLHLKDKKILGKFKIVLEVYNILKNEFPNWEKLEVPQSFIDDYNRERYANRITKTKVQRDNFNIPVRDILKNTAYDMNTIKDIPNFKGIIIYGDVSEKEELLQVGKLIGSYLDRRHNFKNTDTKNKALKVIRIAKGNYKYFKMNKNAIEVKLFNSEENNLMINIAIASIINDDEFSKILSYDRIELITKINRHVGKKLEDLRKFIKTYCLSDNDYLSKFIQNNKDNSILTNHEYMIKWKEIKDYFGDELMFFIVTSENKSTKFIENLTKMLNILGKRIDNDFYLKPESERLRIPTNLPEKVSIFAKEIQLPRFPTREELLENSNNTVKFIKQIA